MLKNKDVFQVMEKWARLDFAYDWDPIGLQVGSKQNEVRKVMITLDVLEDVVDEAIEKDVDLIIAHHPLLFSPLQSIDLESTKGRIVKKLIQHEITVYAAHTNLDIAVGGVNDMLCDELGLQQRNVLVETKSEELVKICVYVPETHVNQLKEALGDAGAGFIGHYSHCQFQTKGTGSFKPLEGTNPFIGKQHQMEYVDEVKIETIVEQRHMNDVVQKMLRAHPYEEPAYDLYPLKNKGTQYGLGRIGELSEPMEMRDFVAMIKQTLDVSHIRLSGQMDSTVKKVAILGGSGEKYWQVAEKKGADVYITGDMTFHPAQDAWQMNMNVIDAGHYIEKVMKKATKKRLDEAFESSLEVMISNVNTDPFQII